MNKKKILRILMPLMVASIIFTGCSNKEESSDNDISATTEAKQETNNDSNKEENKSSDEKVESGKYGQQGLSLIEKQYSGDPILDFRKSSAEKYYSKVDSMISLMDKDITGIINDQKIVAYKDCGNSISLQGVKDYKGMNKDNNLQGILSELRFEDDDKYKDVLESIGLQFNVGQDDSINIDDNTKKILGYITDEVSTDEIVSKLQQAVSELASSKNSSIKSIEIVNKKNNKLYITGNKSEKKGRMIILRLEKTTEYPQ